MNEKSESMRKIDNRQYKLSTRMKNKYIDDVILFGIKMS
jgi:hypothetical protein